MIITAKIQDDQQPEAIIVTVDLNVDDNKMEISIKPENPNIDLTDLDGSPAMGGAVRFVRMFSMDLDGEEMEET